MAHNVLRLYGMNVLGGVYIELHRIFKAYPSVQYIGIVGFLKLILCRHS